MKKSVIALLSAIVLSISLLSCGSAQDLSKEDSSGAAIETPPNVSSNKLSKTRQKN